MSSAKSSQYALMNKGPGRSLMQTEESNGPGTELWGIPYLRDCALAVDAFTVTVCFCL